MFHAVYKTALINFHSNPSNETLKRRIYRPFYKRKTQTVSVWFYQSWSSLKRLKRRVYVDVKSSSLKTDSRVQTKLHNKFCYRLNTFTKVHQTCRPVNLCNKFYFDMCPGVRMLGGVSVRFKIIGKPNARSRWGSFFFFLYLTQTESFPSVAFSPCDPGRFGIGKHIEAQKQSERNQSRSFYIILFEVQFSFLNVSFLSTRRVGRGRTLIYHGEKTSDDRLNYWFARYTRLKARRFPIYYCRKVFSHETYKTPCIEQNREIKIRFRRPVA